MQKISIVEKQYQTYFELIRSSRKYFLGRELFFITIVDRKHKYNEGDLHNFNVLNFRRKIMRQLNKRVDLSVGIIEFSLIEDRSINNKNTRYIWYPHFHIIVSTKDISNLKLYLSKLYKADNYVKRPVLIKKVEDQINLARYMTKNPFECGRSVRFNSIKFHGRLAIRHREELELYIMRLNIDKNGRESLVFSKIMTKRGNKYVII